MAKKNPGTGGRIRRIQKRICGWHVSLVSNRGLRSACCTIHNHRRGDGYGCLGAAAVSVEANPEELKETGTQVVRSMEEIAGGHGLDKVSVSVAGSDPAARIIDYADSKEIDTIVMGTRGLSDNSGLLMGSVSHKVSQLVSCTCVTVRKKSKGLQGRGRPFRAKVTASCLGGRF